MALKRYDSAEQIEKAIDHNRALAKDALLKADEHDKSADLILAQVRSGKVQPARLDEKLDFRKWHLDQAAKCRKRARLRLEGKAKRLGCKLSEFLTELLPAMGEDRSVPVR